jgi:L-arabinokinase
VLFCLQQAGPRAGGIRLLVGSDVPEGKGVASSAALEVAAMAVLAAHYGVPLEPEALAGACQWVENHVVGAPCGLMDQVTSACGRQDRLLRLLCQPARIEGYLTVPPGFRFYGIDSGIRHAVSGADYGTVRAAAFMGYRLLADAAGLPARLAGSRVVVEDPRWQGYLANIAPDVFEAELVRHLPEQMAGRDFLARYGGTTDPVTEVRPDSVYPVRAATAHPVYEHARVRRFAALLEGLARNPGSVVEMGRLLYASHESYGACGLSSDGTNLLVDSVARAGPGSGLFGAKITGGGSGGTVVVFGTDEAAPSVRALARRYAETTGRTVDVFADSGPGAAETGVALFDAP